MKLFLKIISIHDCHKLQHDLNIQVLLGEDLGLFVNTPKYSTIHFTRLRSPIGILFSYNIINIPDKLSGDLGFTLTYYRSPNKNI